MKNLFMIMMCLFLAACSSTQNMRQVETTPTVADAPPPAPELVKVPEGYRSCLWTQAKFLNGQWVPAHEVCLYPRGRSFVSAHWQCRLYTLEQGQCLKWVWVKGKWQR